MCNPDSQEVNSDGGKASVHQGWEVEEGCDGDSTTRDGIMELFYDGYTNLPHMLQFTELYNLPSPKPKVIV